MTSVNGPGPWACVSDVGRQRQGNEDSHAELLQPDGSLLLVVCDGVGGHEAGEVASAIGVETIGRAFGELADVAQPGERLRRAVMAANEAIIEEGARIGKRDMGTTAVVAYVRGHEAWVAHVGDSRCYVFRAGEMVFRTRDHTRVQKMVDLGILTPQQAKEHPEANVIIRALGRRVTPEGVPLEPEVRLNPLRLEPGDALLLCSDGLYDVLGDDDLWNAIADHTPAEATRLLVDQANERGGPDNITATVLVCGQERAPTSATIPPPVGRAVSGEEMERGSDDPPPSRRAVLPVVLGLSLLTVATALAVRAVRPPASARVAEARSPALDVDAGPESFDAGTVAVVAPAPEKPAE